jgi:hypothetical protein
MEEIVIPVSDRACVHGGYCIDPGNPSDCETNSCCFCFRSNKEKTEFDSLPDRYEIVKINKKQKEIIRFKKINQLRFFLRDYTNWAKAKVYIITDDGTFEIKQKDIYRYEP